MNNNELIARFMGLQEGYPHKIDKYGYCQCEEGFHVPQFVNLLKNENDYTEHEFLIEQLEYDKSWDWLFPVLVKINQLGFPFAIHPTFCSIGFHDLKYVDVQHDMEGRLSILEFTYKSVITFILWYNNINQVS